MVAGRAAHGRRRPGRSSLGCLLFVVLVAILAYVGTEVGGVYWRNYQFQDAFNQAARFAAHDSDTAIQVRLSAVADSLGLPRDARRIHVHRTSKGISIWSEYTDTVEIPGLMRTVDFLVHAEQRF